MYIILDMQLNYVKQSRKLLQPMCCLTVFPGLTVIQIKLIKIVWLFEILVETQLDCAVCAVYALKLIPPFKVLQPVEKDCAIFLSWPLTVKPLEPFQLDCPNCAVQLIKPVMCFFQLNHFKLVWLCEQPRPR